MSEKKQFEEIIDAFLAERLAAKLAVKGDDDSERDKLLGQYQRPAWLADAARRVGQLNVVTHTLKGIHPDAKGTSLFVDFPNTAQSSEVSSKSISSAAVDVVGNAAALDVYKFLKLEVEGQSLLVWLERRNAGLLAALSSDPVESEHLASAFCAVKNAGNAYVSHQSAKQIYWPVSPSPEAYEPNPHDAAHFHLLAPLYASVFSHHLYSVIQHDRFDEKCVEARAAARAKQFFRYGYSEYPYLAEEKKGGTKPQNISQLNSERKGSSYLLCSLPPIWKSSGLRPIFAEKNCFRIFGARRDIRNAMRELRESLVYLNSEATFKASTMEIRARRDAAVGEIIDQLIQFGATYINDLPPGWSSDARCELSLAQQCWLDPYRAVEDEAFYLRWDNDDWPEQLASEFGAWFNHALENRGDKKLGLGDVEMQHWKSLLKDDLHWQRLLDIDLVQAERKNLEDNHEC